jgi:hypothetical protein
MKFLSVLILLMATSFFTSATGQEAGVTVKGVVVDWQYARVPPTTLVFESEGQTKEVKVDDQGAYEVQLPPGLYTVKATAPGFRERRVKLQLAPAAPRILNIMLQVPPQPRLRCPPGSICL